MKYLNEKCIPNHNYFNYKQPFVGSFKKMRFRVACELPEEEGGDKQYLAITYPDVFCFEKTAKEDMQEMHFPFSLDGRMEVIEWLDSQYEQMYM